MSSVRYEGLNRKEQKSSCCCQRIPLCCKIIMVGGLVAILSVIGLFVGFSATNPIHASCTVDWTFPSISCDAVRGKLKNQINTWSTKENCKNGGEKCLYKLVSENNKTLKATHTTPNKGYVDDLTFTFSSAGSNCNTEGYSTSETWYAVLDQGTNYCNLHNLITGSGLNNITGYSESTSNSRCTQYSSANCEKY